MEFKSQYVAHTPNSEAWMKYNTSEDYRVWAALFEQQLKDEMRTESDL